MKLSLTKSFDRGYEKLSIETQKHCDKQLLILLKNPRHPSLRTKKVQGSKDIWEGRITKDIRFTFQIIGDTYIFRRIGKHDEVLRKP